MLELLLLEPFIADAFLFELAIISGKLVLAGCLILQRIEMNYFTDWPNESPRLLCLELVSRPKRHGDPSMRVPCTEAPQHTVCPGPLLAYLAHLSPQLRTLTNSLHFCLLVSEEQAPY